MTDDWSRVDYRRLIAWPERIAREWPFLERVLADAPSKRVLDLGAGTGEHSRLLAAHGYHVVGIDSSPSMLARAQDEPLPPNLRFLQADIADVGALGVAPAGAVICLGNTLPHLEEDDMRRLAQGLAGVLLPGAPCVFQILNYERLRAKKIRHLPLNVRPGDDGSETLFLRVIDMREDGRAVFTPATLRYRPDHDPPIEVMHARSVSLRAWTWSELAELFSAAGFRRATAFGGFDASPFSPEESADVLAVLTR